MGARSESGGRHCRAHAASAAATRAGGAVAPPSDPPLVETSAPIGQAQFHVAGQSVSTSHAPVGCATQVLHVMDEHVVAFVGFKLTLGGATGGRTLAQGTLVAMAYGGTLAWDGGTNSS